MASGVTARVRRDGRTVSSKRARLPLGLRFAGWLLRRHRAAVGLSNESDAVVIVVSEETGDISIAERGVLMCGSGVGASVARLCSVSRR